MSSNTPNVSIENPKVRKAIRTTLDTIGALTFIAIAIDAAAPEFDISAITTPIMAGYGAARSAFGFLVDNPHTPKAGKYGDYSEDAE